MQPPPKVKLSILPCLAELRVPLRFKASSDINDIRSGIHALLSFMKRVKCFWKGPQFFPFSPKPLRSDHTGVCILKPLICHSKLETPGRVTHLQLSSFHGFRSDLTSSFFIQHFIFQFKIINNISNLVKIRCFLADIFLMFWLLIMFDMCNIVLAPVVHKIPNRIGHILVNPPYYGDFYQLLWDSPVLLCCV